MLEDEAETVFKKNPEVKQSVEFQNKQKGKLQDAYAEDIKQKYEQYLKVLKEDTLNSNEIKLNIMGDILHQIG